MTGVGGIIGSYTEGELVGKTVFSEIHANKNEGERERTRQQREGQEGGKKAQVER